MSAPVRAPGLLRRGAALSLLLSLLALALSVTGSTRLERADFVMNNGTEVSTLDPASVTGVPEGRVMYALYEGLTVKHPETLEPLPGMAESWEVSEDGTVYTFHIREDARWSNGDPVTAHDFEWSWQRLLLPETAAEYSYQLWYVRGARQFSMLPDDRFFGHMVHGVWVQEIGNGRARVGLHGFFLDQVADRYGPDTRVLRSVEVDTVLEHRDDWFVTLGEDGGHIHTFVTGRVTAVNEECARTIGELLDDPYEANWIFELELDPGTVQEALEERDLLEAQVASDELFWPRVGARATSEHTFVVTLESATPFFLFLTSFYPTMPTHRPTWEWARETYPDSWQIEWIAPENIVTNGPFLLAERASTTASGS